MKRYSDLQELLAHIWHQIQQGAADPGHPFHTPTFGTANGAPNLRTVILRHVDVETRSLFFHSDRRARKIEEIKANPQIMWHFWSAATQEQLRLVGEATLHFEDKIADALWQNTRPKSLKIYVKPVAPNTKVPAPQSGIDPKIAEVEVSSHAEVAEGRQHFATIQTKISEISFLHLHPEGNYRALFQWTPEGKLASAWVIP